MPTGRLPSSAQEGFHRGSTHVVPRALLHHQPAAEGEAAGAGEWGPSWHGTLLAQDPRRAGLRLLSLWDSVVEAACAVQPHLLEAAEHQTFGIPLPISSKSSPTFLGVTPAFRLPLTGADGEDVGAEGTPAPRMPP